MEEHKLDRRSSESNEDYNARINAAADEAGMSRAEYERQANEEAGRPPITRQDGDGQEGATGTI